jgi:hypothetical protein
MSTDPTRTTGEAGQPDRLLATPGLGHETTPPSSRFFPRIGFPTPFHSPTLWTRGTPLVSL